VGGFLPIGLPFSGEGAPIPLPREEEGEKEAV